MRLKRLVFASLFLGSSVFAANGTNLIGVSPVSNAMGGTGVAGFLTGSDALFKNSANIVGMPGKDGAFIADLHGTFTKFSVTTNPGPFVGGTAGPRDSQAGGKVLPNLSLLYKIDSDITVGLGVSTYAGASVDFNGEVGLVQLKSQLDQTRVMPAVGYKISESLSVGLSPFMNYSRFAINDGISGTQSSRGQDTALGFGFSAGLNYRASKELQLGAVFNSKSTLNHKGIIDLDYFGPSMFTTGGALDDVTLQTPMEIALGGVYSPGTNWKALLDLRWINWANAEGYRHFGWRNQFVVALGGQYNVERLALRAGFNWAPAPIESATGENGSTIVDVQSHQFQQKYISALNLTAFPAVSTMHFTAGAGYQINNDLRADVSALWAPKQTITRSGILGTEYSYVASASQYAITAGATYQF